MFASRSKPLAGLDITTSSIKLIELVPNGRGYRVECYAAEPSPPNSITEKSIVDADAVGEAVRRAVKRASTKASEVAIAISGGLCRTSFQGRRKSFLSHGIFLQPSPRAI